MSGLTSAARAAAGELIARQAIAGALARHSQGVDRADVELLKSAYHAGASVEYGFFNGPATELATILAQAQRKNAVTLHRTSNIWARVKGARARSESYVMAYMEHGIGAQAVQRLIGGRYLDEHECREGEWRLTKRKYVMDWNTNRRSTASWPDPPASLAAFGPRGGHGANDTGRALLATLAARLDIPGKTSMSSNSISDEAIDQALSKQALHDLAMAYARAVDRADAELLASLFHEDATIVSGVINGAAPRVTREITEFVTQNLERCFHSVANEWYEIRGDRAIGESYVIATVTAGGQDIMTGGRYIDSFERRNGAWKFSSRDFVMDWSTTHTASFEPGGMYASLKTRGCYGKKDPIYDFWT
jgi:ketosteroid isomerase-like protein